MHDPRESHMTALKHILCYLQGTLDFGLLLHPSSIFELVDQSKTFVPNEFFVWPFSNSIFFASGNKLFENTC
jgi:hypothetical protein